ncbi:hypothetical protein SBV1_290001 [Verrucomicrobia bacterium]|nr:hypothetical protein SBV1_290001 [Verrucomicrobiota bacterium]
MVPGQASCSVGLEGLLGVPPWDTSAKAVQPRDSSRRMKARWGSGESGEVGGNLGIALGGEFLVK